MSIGVPGNKGLTSSHQTGPMRSPATPEHAPTRVSLLGGEVDLVTPGEVLDFIDARVAAGRGAVIANHNLHSLYLRRRLLRMRQFYEIADLVEADSTPMILWGRLLGFPIRREHRCTYLDWREDFWARAGAGGWRVFYLGGAPGVAARGAQAVRLRHPGVEITTRDGFFDPAFGSDDTRAVLGEIAAVRPQVLFVGMGMPRQEHWILDNADALARYVVLPVGAAFDYEAGVIPTPPRWMGAAGLEWAFRLVSEPRRLFARYVLEPWALLPLAAADVAGRLAPRRP